jgi:hypothetical protein
VLGELHRAHGSGASSATSLIQPMAASPLIRS